MISRATYEERERLDTVYLKSFKIFLFLYVCPLFVFVLTQEFAYVFVSSFIAIMYSFYHNKKYCHLRCKEEL